jgi:hypothetical protein
VAGEENTIELTDASIKTRKGYEMKPGMYTVRVVVRDSEERDLTAANASGEVR